MSKDDYRPVMQGKNPRPFLVQEDPLVRILEERYGKGTMAMVISPVKKGKGVRTTLLANPETASLSRGKKGISPKTPFEVLWAAFFAVNNLPLLRFVWGMMPQEVRRFEVEGE